MTGKKATIFPSSTLNSMKVPLYLLFEDKTLFHYFQNVLIDCKIIKDILDINLLWPTSSEFYIDPKIKEGIESWDSNVLVSDIPFTLKDYGNYQESLNDNWTLYAWSKWWQNLNQRKSTHSKITILHLDDHDDLMSPKIYINNGKLYDLLTHKPVSIFDPNSIKSAILSSSIGIGEFILPFLWETSCEIDIRHLCERKRNDKYRHFSLELGSTPDLLQPSLQRLSVDINPFQNTSQSRITYFVTEDINELLNIDPNGLILLHIDLDYFNNRYDGCTNWQEKKRTYNPQRECIRSCLKDFFESLKINKLMPYIHNVTVSTSPGFFPAEYWAESLSVIRYQVLKNLSPCLASFNEKALIW